MSWQESFENNLFNYEDIPEPSSSDLNVAKIDPDIMRVQTYAIKQSSRKYFQKKPVWPRKTVFRKLKKALGVELESNYKKYIIYDPKIKDSYDLKQKVATEEAIHLQQKGKKVLLPIVIVYDFGLMKYIVPIGQILYEGGIRPIAKQSNLPIPNGYPEIWYRMAEEVDQVIPLKVWYDTAERDVEDGGKPKRILDLIKNPKIKRIIERYTIRPDLNMYV